MRTKKSISILMQISIWIKLLVIFFFEKILNRQIKLLGIQFIKKMTFKQLIFLLDVLTKKNLKDTIFKEALRIARINGSFAKWNTIYKHLEVNSPIIKEAILNMSEKANSFDEWSNLYELVAEKNDTFLKKITALSVDKMVEKAFSFWELIFIAAILLGNDPRKKEILIKINDFLNLMNSDRYSYTDYYGQRTYGLY